MKEYNNKENEKKKVKEILIKLLDYIGFIHIENSKEIDIEGEQIEFGKDLLIYKLNKELLEGLCSPEEIKINEQEYFIERKKAIYYS